MQYYGFALSPQELDAALLKDTEGGSFLTELARYARSRGLLADCFAFNLYLTDPSDATLSPLLLVKKLRDQQLKLNDQWYQFMVTSTILSISAGVKYIIQKPQLSTITSYLSRSIPLIVTVSYAALHNHQGDPFIGHDILLTGFDQGYLYFIDPLHSREQGMPASDILFALLSRKVIAASAYMLAIKK